MAEKFCCGEPLARRWEGLLTIIQILVTNLVGLPTPNPHREVQEGDVFHEEVYSITKGGWDMVERRGRNGLFCGVREMQLVVETPRGEGDSNWQDVLDIPWGTQQLHFPH